VKWERRSKGQETSVGEEWRDSRPVSSLSPHELNIRVHEESAEVKKVCKSEDL